ncbi:MAG: alpha/beta hydrolase-fold protein [Planctomycetota bacterium]
MRPSSRISAIRVLSALLLFCLTTASAMASDDDAINIGVRRTIQSEILDQEREYLVYLPASYESDRYLPKSYPVMFVLDGGTHFHYVSGMTSYMGMVGQIPEMIVVAIPHVNRTRELTPTQSNLSFQGKVTETFSDSGGADDFLAFLTEELIPAVDAEYRTRPFRILNGHSFGGLFAAHAFLRGGDHFHAFLLADPSLWWDDQVMVKSMEQAIEDGDFANRGGSIFIATAERPTGIDDNEDLKTGVENHFGGIESFVAALEPASDTRRRLHRTRGETHGSVPVQTLYQGLRFTFEGYQPATEMFLLEPGKLADHYSAFSEKVGAEFLPDEQMLDMMALGMLAQDDFRTNAVRLLEINVANYPDSPNTYASLAAAFAASDEPEKAREQFERALELDPENTAALAGLEQLDAAEERRPAPETTDQVLDENAGGAGG